MYFDAVFDFDGDVLFNGTPLEVRAWLEVPENLLRAAYRIPGDTLIPEWFDKSKK